MNSGIKANRIEQKFVMNTPRRVGRRFVEEALLVKGYEAAENQWDIRPIWPLPGAPKPHVPSSEA